jgi:hypothetical protein
VAFWENSIATDPKETGWDDVNWINLALDRDKWRAVLTAAVNL